MAMTYTVGAETIGLLMVNAVENEKNMQLIANAATTVTTALIIQFGAAGAK